MNAVANSLRSQARGTGLGGRAEKIAIAAEALLNNVGEGVKGITRQKQCETDEHCHYRRRTGWAHGRGGGECRRRTGRSL